MTSSNKKSSDTSTHMPIVHMPDIPTARWYDGAKQIIAADKAADKKLIRKGSKSKGGDV